MQQINLTNYQISIDSLQELNLQVIAEIKNLAEIKSYLRNIVMPPIILSLSHIEKDQCKDGMTLSQALCIAYSYVIDVNYIINLRNLISTVDELMKASSIEEINNELKVLKIIMSELGTDVSIECKKL